jgi:hypothetical protein
MNQRNKADIVVSGNNESTEKLLWDVKAGKWRVCCEGFKK